MKKGAPDAKLSASGLSFRAGGISILEDFAVELSPGEVVGLIGPNGAGKTTAIDLLSGFREPAAGSVRLADRELTGMPADRRARMGLARTFQESPAIPGLSARDHVRLALEAGGRTRAKGCSPEEILDRVGLEDDAARDGDLLPIGKRRLLDVARALATAPEVLLLDEPFAGLERHEEKRLNAILAELRREGRSVLIVEHRLSLLGGVADSVLVLVQGRLVTRGTMESVLRDPAVQRAYLHSQGSEAEA
jgi:ABC-type branched-subunit amino acid transport system ATPase component